MTGEDTGRNLSQAAIKFCLYQPSIVSVLPNFTTVDELTDYSEAIEVPDITDGEQSILDDLWKNDFYLEAVSEFREV